MKLQRSLSILVVFLMLSGNLLGSEPYKILRVRESNLGTLVRGKKATLQLTKGARVEGRIQKVTALSLVFKVKTSSDPAAYPKGKMRIPRAAVSRIEVRGLKANNRKQVLATVGTFAGALLGAYSVARFSGAGSDSGGTVAEGMVVVAIPIGAAILVYRTLAPKDLTTIEFLPDFPGEGGPKPTDKDRGTSPTDSGATPGHSLVEPSGPKQIRLQARRTLMRKNIPLRLYLPGEPRTARTAGPGH